METDTSEEREKLASKRVDAKTNSTSQNIALLADEEHTGEQSDPTTILKGVIKVKVIANSNVMVSARRGFYSFINPNTLLEFKRNGKQYNELEFGVDGLLLSVLFSLMYRKKVERVSFDFTSIASLIFEEAEKKSLRVALVGARESELDSFIHKLRFRYPNLEIAFFHSGYFPQTRSSVLVSEIMSKKADLIVCSMGAVKQEDFLNALGNAGFEGKAFSSGAFFTQYSGSKRFNYYPEIMNKLNLRFLYRMYKEPHTISRYLISYPLSILMVLRDISFGKLKIEIIDE